MMFPDYPQSRIVPAGAEHAKCCGAPQPAKAKSTLMTIKFVKSEIWIGVRWKTIDYFGNQYRRTIYFLCLIPFFPICWERFEENF